ncbi:MAG: division/cell wall cluster transcriptional repressor MraZ [Bacteroidia bacterium]
MTQLIGEYICKLDAKGRLTMPAALKKQIPNDAQEKFVVNRGFENCLNLFPLTEWNKVTAKIQKLNLYKKENRDFQRRFHRGATALELDASSRVNLPKGLLQYAGITKEVVLFAHGDKIEIWDKTAYDAMFDESEDDFAELAENVMGQFDKIDDIND